MSHSLTSKTMIMKNDKPFNNKRNMKKLMIALAFVGLATSSMAQDYNVVPTKKYSVAIKC